VRDSIYYKCDVGMLSTRLFRVRLTFMFCQSLISFTDCHTTASTSSQPLDEYTRRVNEKQIQSDTHQLKVVNELQRLHEDVNKLGITSTGFLQVCLFALLFVNRFVFQRLLSRTTKQTSPRGVYVYGSVGVGKTMLMDLFYECCTSKSKRRMHYNEFMGDIHKSE
jgi:protein AFG1